MQFSSIKLHPTEINKQHKLRSRSGRQQLLLSTASCAQYTYIDCRLNCGWSAQVNHEHDRNWVKNHTCHRGGQDRLPSSSALATCLSFTACLSLFLWIIPEEKNKSRWAHFKKKCLKIGKKCSNSKWNLLWVQEDLSWSMLKVIYFTAAPCR